MIMYLQIKSDFLFMLFTTETSKVLEQMRKQTRPLVKSAYGKCSKISNTLKLRTPKIITENNF